MSKIFILLFLTSCAMSSKFKLYQTVSTKSNCTGQILGIKTHTLYQTEYIVEGCGRVAESEIL